MNIPIIFEDDTLLIINKPAGITVNRAVTTKHEETIQDWSEKYLGITFNEVTVTYTDKEWNPELDFYQRGGIVHRIDKETSGILIIAKSPAAFVNLQKQFKERNVKKTYTALAHGMIVPKEGEINVPVGRLPWNKKQFGILPGGKESKTLYTILSSYQMPKTEEKLSLVELYPQSGRTHQIRVHLKYINHPIFSDFLYAGRKTARADRKFLARVFLHASKISFLHPVTSKQVSFEALLAEELVSLLQSIDKIDE